MGYEKGDRGGSRRGAQGVHGVCMGNVYTIPEMVYSGALCDEGMLRWMICKPPWITLSSHTKKD